MAKLTMTKGLPGSGKTTWAKEQQAQALAQGISIKRVNKDDLRDMVDNGHWSKANEPFIVACRNSIVSNALDAGFDVIVDDTGFNRAHEDQLSRIASRRGHSFQVWDFTDVPLETCIERDSKRSKPVGEAVIRKMYESYLKPRASNRGEEKAMRQEQSTRDEATVQPAPPFDPALPSVYLVDIDGTVALKGDRARFDESKVIVDLPNRPVIDVVRSLMKAGHQVVFMSGRQEYSRVPTYTWLNENVSMATCFPSTEGGWHDIHMRATGDSRKDYIVKRELYDKHIRGHFNVLGVFDDRQQVVDMWRGLGLTVFQVAPGDF